MPIIVCVMFSGGSAVVAARRTVAGYVALTKPRIIELLLVTTVPTMFVAAHHVPSGWLILATVGGGALAAGGANATNMVADRDIDALMQRTVRRPLVTGVVSPVGALCFAGGLEVAAFVELWWAVNLLSAVLALAATAFYVFVYTLWLKRTSSQNIVIGGAAGAVPVLVGWSAVTGRLAVAPFVLFAIVFLWTPPHFWALAVRYRGDYTAANVPMLPSMRSSRAVAWHILAYTVAVSATAVAFSWVAGMGPVYLVTAVVLGVGFIGFAIAFLRAQTSTMAMAMFHYSISYLTLLFVAMGINVLVTGIR